MTFAFEEHMTKFLNLLATDDWDGGLQYLVNFYADYASPTEAIQAAIADREAELEKATRFTKLEGKGDG